MNSSIPRYLVSSSPPPQLSTEQGVPDEMLRAAQSTKPNSLARLPLGDGLTALDDALADVGLGRCQLTLLLLCAGTQLADGAELMILSYVTADAFWCTTPFAQAGVSGKDLVQTAVFVGMLCGALVLGLLADVCGRKAGCVAGLACTGLGGLAAAWAPTLPLLALSRFVVGIGAGGAPAALALYSEFLPPSRRGSRLILFFLFFSIGTLLESLLAWASLELLNGGYRTLFVLSALPSLLLLLASPALPESPRYLMLRGRTDAACQTLRWAASLNGRVLQPRTAEMLRSIEAPAASYAARSREWMRQAARDVGRLFSAAVLRTTSTCCALFFLMAFVYYALVLLQPQLVDLAARGASAPPPHAARCQPPYTPLDYAGNVVTAAGEIPGLGAAALLLEAIGRRRTLALFFGATGALLVVLLLPIAQPLGIVLLCATRATALGYNQSLWVYATEVFPTTVRASAVGLCSCFARVAGLAAVPTLGALWPHSHGATIVLCAAGCAFSAVLSLSLPTDSANAALADAWVDTKPRTHAPTANYVCGTDPHADEHICDAYSGGGARCQSTCWPRRLMPETTATAVRSASAAQPLLEPHAALPEHPTAPTSSLE